MNRSSTPLVRPKAAKSRISSSLSPRTTTQLTFTGSRPAARAASMPASTCVEGVAAGDGAKRSGRSESQEMLMRRSPARARSAAMMGEGGAVGGHGQVHAEVGQAAGPAPAGGPARSARRR